MATYSIAEASRELPRLIAEAKRGEEVSISDGGQVVARLQPTNGQSDAEFYAEVYAAALAGPRLDADSVELVRRVRDGEPP